MSGIIISDRPDYLVKIQKEERAPDNGDWIVTGLEICRPNFGRIRFLQPIILKESLNIDHLLVINHKEVNVYPEISGVERPLIGEELNCSAEVTLERVWPGQKSNHSFLGHCESKLKQICGNQGAEFVSYDKQSGTLKFKVSHFSRYSCIDEELSDQEESAQSDRNNFTVPHMSETSGRVNTKAGPKREPALIQKKTLHDRRLENRVGEEMQKSSENLIEPIHVGDGDHLDSHLFVEVCDKRNKSEKIEKEICRNYDAVPIQIDPPLLSSSPISSKKRQLYSSAPNAINTTASDSLRLQLLLRTIFVENEEVEDAYVPAPTPPKRPKSLLAPPFTTSLVREKEAVEFLSVGSSDSEDVFSILHHKEMTTQCKMFGAPRVCFTKSGAFLTIQNQLTSKGFQGKATINMIDSYFDKQELCQPLSDNYRTTLKDELTLRLQNQGEVLFKEYADLLRKRMAKLSSPPSMHYLKSELLIWELCDILWPEEVIDENEQLDYGFLLIQRQKLSHWLVENASLLFGEIFSASDNSVFGLLKKGRIEDACELALSQGNYYLAAVIASENPPCLQYSELKEVFQFFPEHASDILYLLNGFLQLEELTEHNVTNMSTSHWLQYFAMYLWYHDRGRGICVPVDAAVRNFEGMMRQITQDDETPLPKYEDSSAANLCMHLLKMYSCTGYPIPKLLSPQVWTNDSLDYKLSWLLLTNFEVIGYVPENEFYSHICSAFSGQLEQIGMFEWAVFVSKCHIPPEVDDDIVLDRAANKANNLHEKQLLEKHLESGHENLETEVFLTSQLGIDDRLIFSIKGEKASKMYRYDQMIGYFRKARKYQKAFDVLKGYLDDYGIELVCRDDIANANSRNVLKHLLTLYPFRQNVTGWDIHGEMMINYFKLSKTQKILASTCFPSLPSSSSSSNSQVMDEGYLESAVVKFVRALLLYHPKTERQSSFLLSLTLTAQKAIQLILVDPKVEQTIKDDIQQELINLLKCPVPKEYFGNSQVFIKDLITKNL